MLLKDHGRGRADFLAAAFAGKLAVSAHTALDRGSREHPGGQGCFLVFHHDRLYVETLADMVL